MVHYAGHGVGWHQPGLYLTDFFWFLFRNDNVALLNRKGNEATLNVPDNLPTVWETRRPAL